LAALVPFAGAAASSATMHPEAAALNPSWTMDEPGLGTWETCDTCDQCVLDAVPGGVPPPSRPRARTARRTARSAWGVR
jgi:hypothetical protein